jgi:hypothetical protein
MDREADHAPGRDRGAEGAKLEAGEGGGGEAVGGRLLLLFRLLQSEHAQGKS